RVGQVFNLLSRAGLRVEDQAPFQGEVRVKAEVKGTITVVEPLVHNDPHPSDNPGDESAGASKRPRAVVGMVRVGLPDDCSRVSHRGYQSEMRSNEEGRCTRKKD